MRKALFIISALVLTGGAVLFSQRNIPNFAQTAQAQAAPPDFSGIWLAKFRQSFSLADPGGKKFGMEPDISYTAWGLEKVRSAKPTLGPNSTFVNTNDLALKYADPDGYPRAEDHPMRFKIVQTPNFVYFLYEYDQAWRPVALNAKHSEDPDPTWYGESVGKWDGDTLVVDAIGFNDRAWLDPIGHPRSEQMHLTERWRRVDHDKFGGRYHLRGSGGVHTTVEDTNELQAGSQRRAPRKYLHRDGRVAFQNRHAQGHRQDCK